MKYISGQIHESLQKTRYILLLNNFNCSVCEKRQIDLISSLDYDKKTDILELKKNDILKIKYYKVTSNSHGVYVYLENINDSEINKETLLSKEFMDINYLFFKDITKAYERDSKLKKLLNV